MEVEAFSKARLKYIWSTLCIYLLEQSPFMILDVNLNNLVKYCNILVIISLTIM